MLRRVWLLIEARIECNPCYQNGPHIICIAIYVSHYVFVKQNMDHDPIGTFVFHGLVYTYIYMYIHIYIYGLVQDCSISIANALEILQSCTKPSIYNHSHNAYCTKLFIAPMPPLRSLCYKRQRNSLSLHMRACCRKYSQTHPAQKESSSEPSSQSMTLSHRFSSEIQESRARFIHWNSPSWHS